MIPIEVVNALWSLDWFQAEILPDVAADWLEVGQDSPSLRILAGLVRPTHREAEPVFRQALTEQGVRQPSKEQAAEIIARYIASETLSGSITPYQCASRIGYISSLVNYASPYAHFLSLEDDWICMPQERGAIEADILNAAKELVKKQDGT